MHINLIIFGNMSFITSLILAMVKEQKRKYPHPVLTKHGTRGSKFYPKIKLLSGN